MLCLAFISFIENGPGLRTEIATIRYRFARRHELLHIFPFG